MSVIVRPDHHTSVLCFPHTWQRDTRPKRWRGSQKWKGDRVFSLADAWGRCPVAGVSGWYGMGTELVPIPRGLVTIRPCTRAAGHEHDASRFVPPPIARRCADALDGGRQDAGRFALGLRGHHRPVSRPQAAQPVLRAGGIRRAHLLGGDVELAEQRAVLAPRHAGAEGVAAVGLRSAVLSPSAAAADAADAVRRGGQPAPGDSGVLARPRSGDRRRGDDLLDVAAESVAADALPLWLPVLAVALDPLMTFISRKLWVDGLVGGFGGLALGLLCVAADRRCRRSAIAAGIALGLAALPSCRPCCSCPSASSWFWF